MKNFQQVCLLSLSLVPHPHPFLMEKKILKLSHSFRHSTANRDDDVMHSSSLGSAVLAHTLHNAALWHRVRCCRRDVYRREKGHGLKVIKNFVLRLSLSLYRHQFRAQHNSYNRRNNKLYTILDRFPLVSHWKLLFGSRRQRRELGDSAFR
jgi:hypothetical protein